MKLFLPLIAALVLFAQSLFSQCDIAVTIVNQPSGCYNDPIVFVGFGSAVCPNYATIQYTWETWVNDLEGNQVIAPELTQSGIAPSLTSIPTYQVDLISTPAFGQACLTITLLDDIGGILGIGQYCSAQYTAPTPLAVNVNLQSNQCGSMCASIIATGGSAPYQYLLSNGEILGPNNWTCFEVEGMYTVSVVDANGCMAETQFVVQGLEPQNNTCTNSTSLTSGVVETDTLCSLEFNTPSCGGFTYYLSGWYQINSENFSHLNLGFNQSYWGSAINQGFNVEVYESNGGDCNSAPLVYCHEMNAGSCFDLADEITIQPNTTYYFHVAVQWTSQIEVSILAVLSNDAIDPICGCTNPDGCNYNPDALINDYSCETSGCTDAGACNYFLYAQCDDGSCVYGDDFNGQVYHDVNGNGIWESFNEPTLGNIGIITITELNLVVYPNAEGAFVIPDLPSGVYTITFTDANGSWIMSPDSPSQLTLPTCNGLKIGLVPSDESMAQISNGTWMWSQNILCVNGFNPGVWIQNTGNVPLNGTFTMSFDPFFATSNAYGYEPYDSFVDGVITWNIENQLPGTAVYYAIHINGPGASYVGQAFIFELDLNLVDGSGNTFYQDNWTLTPIVVCSYDPNDKQAVPEGYADPHFILADDEIEYRIRFQNTGNAPAEDVMIEDQIEIANLDMTTFYPVSGSHSFSTIVNEDGRIQFVFNNIDLPDSGSNQLGSQGYVVYRIKPVQGIAQETMIHNTANIYFDQNEAVVTNTTFHTIYSCDMIQALSTEEEICAGLTYSYELNDEYIETYAWSVDDEITSTTNIFIYQSVVAGDHVVSLERTNPLCEVTEEFVLHNHPIPGTDISENGWVLTAPDGTFWDWFLNDEPIAGEHNQTYTATAAGMYTVNTVNEFGCVTTSEDVFLVGIEEKTNAVIWLYPNPMEKETLLKLGQGNYEVTLINLVGEKIQTWSNAKNVLRIDRSSLSSGIYFVKVTNEAGMTESVRLVMK